MNAQRVNTAATPMAAVHSSQTSAGSPTNIFNLLQKTNSQLPSPPKQNHQIRSLQTLNSSLQSTAVCSHLSNTSPSMRACQHQRLPIQSRDKLGLSSETVKSTEESARSDMNESNNKQQVRLFLSSTLGFLGGLGIGFSTLTLVSIRQEPSVFRSQTVVQSAKTLTSLKSKTVSVNQTTGFLDDCRVPPGGAPPVNSAFEPC